MPNLPIDTVLPEIKTTLSTETNVILIAPPGAGKTTGVPLALLNESWLGGKKIIMLEPRRLAAKNAAIWMAKQLGEPVGQTVGYRIRRDTQVSKKTKIEVVTEGILTRIIQNDFTLDDYALIIFDEFHERSLHADLGLALTLDIQKQLRDSLKIIVMSATIEGEAVSTILGEAPIIKSEGRRFPVDIKYADVSANHLQGRHTNFKNNISNRIENSVVACTLQVLKSTLKDEQGSLLLFLPGAAEIHRTHQLLLSALSSTNKSDKKLSIYPLFSALPQAEQEKAIAPCRNGERKIVIATSIAETSLTIDGISVVIDGGLVRQPAFDSRNGLSALKTVRVSKASADQRAGRAGRIEPGVCYRLWTAAEHAGLITQNQVEINQADLTSLTLELAQWGVSDANKLSWIDNPPSSAFAKAQKLLQSLGGLDHDALITKMGTEMQQLSLHPRLAHMVIKSLSLGFGGLACDVAAILNERDFFRLTRGESLVDLAARVISLRQPKGSHIDRVTQQRILSNANELRKQFNVMEVSNNKIDKLGILLAFAYPDRIACTRALTTAVAKNISHDSVRFQLSNGVGAQLTAEDVLSTSQYLVIASLRGSLASQQHTVARITLAAPIAIDDIETYLNYLLTENDVIEWNSTAGSVVTQSVRCLGELVLSRRPLSKPDPEKISMALILGIKQHGISALPWTKQDRAWQQRLVFLKQAQPDNNWPNVSDDYLLANLESWLLPYLTGLSRLDQLKKLDFSNVLKSLLDWNKQQLMNECAPVNFHVPSGSHIVIDYSQVDTPFLAVRIQELFGLENTPAINQGRTKLLIHLLTPARRPIQVTQDLLSFWDNTYTEVKKELKGRYPKHYWPDNPRQATATKKIKKWM